MQHQEDNQMIGGGEAERQNTPYEIARDFRAGEMDF